MERLSQELLEKLVEDCRPYTKRGKVAGYIPALKSVDRSFLSIAVFDGKRMLSAGDTEKRFTLQSISKVIALMLALMDNDASVVFSKVGMEPTGDPFNSIAKFENLSPQKPLNPMINAGALTVTSMVKGKNNDEKLDRLLSLVRKLANNGAICVNEEVAKSEFETAYLNRALCYFLRQHGIIQDDVEELLDLYTKQCAIEVTSEDLARIGYCIANRGIHPQTKKALIPEKITRIAIIFMVTCGMYNASGEFAIKVGIPAKSGVSGGIMCAYPLKCGIGVFSPSLDDKGNSFAGWKLLEKLGEVCELSIF